MDRATGKPTQYPIVSVNNVFIFPGSATLSSSPSNKINLSGIPELLQKAFTNLGEQLFQVITKQPRSHPPSKGHGHQPHFSPVLMFYRKKLIVYLDSAVVLSAALSSLSVEAYCVIVLRQAGPGFLTAELYFSSDELSLTAQLNSVVATHPRVTVGSYPAWSGQHYRTKVGDLPPPQPAELV